MGLNEDQVRLIEAARALVARGDTKFTISALCAKAGVDREVFHRFFSGKRALLAALDAPAEPVPQADGAVPVQPVAAMEAAAPAELVAAPAEPAIPASDAWLERRLRVFERALTALEAKADLTARAHALAIARLEEKLAGVSVTPHAVLEEMPPTPVPEEKPEPPAPRPAPDLLLPEPVPMVAPSREEMSEVLQAARVLASAPVEPPPRWQLPPLRWLVLGTFAVMVLTFWAGLTLGYSAGANAPGQGITRRHASAGEARLMAQADAGDPRAQLQLALSYLHDGDTQGAARWSAAAAESGQPVAEYVAGTMAANKERAFALFQAAADKGNLKAMHNLAIAYAQGQGTHRDERQAADWFAKAAERGYVDSAFDLAVLFERGLGVPQDLRQALKWYGVAALAGDAPSKERAAFLRTQMKTDDVLLADAAAKIFAPLPALDHANRF